MVLQEAVASATERCSVTEQQVKAARAQVQKADRRHAELGPQWTAAQKQREAATALDSELRLAQRDVETTGREVARIATELQAATAAAARVAELGSLLTPTAALREEAASLTRDAEGNNRRAAKGAERKEIVRRRKELAKLLDKAPSEAQLEGATTPSIPCGRHATSPSGRSRRGARSGCRTRRKPRRSARGSATSTRTSRSSGSRS